MFYISLSITEEEEEEQEEGQEDSESLWLSGQRDTQSASQPDYTRPEPEQTWWCRVDMERLGFLLLLCGLLHQGSGLRCFKCSDYTGRCENVQECTYEDSCISLSERGGKTIRQCIRYTDCDNSRLSQMFPAVSGFTYRCCSSNLCNAAAPPPVLVLGLGLSLLSLWWSLV
uniref:MAC-inhibitory protein n=1 Tax=Gasterosteus aculeatus aculeatus TaxID=481459 RepID=A0AAQ4RP10_GASAC